MAGDEIVADRLEGIPHPAQSSELVGHTEASSHLLKHYKSGRMHHAWLLTGPRGIGKATLAMHMAAHVFRFPLAAEAPEHFLSRGDNDPVTGKIAAQSHPNLLHLTRPWDPKTKKFKTQLTVDEVRRTVPFFGTSRGEDGWRVTLVDAGDDMNSAASNALLKILEEPPDNSLFFIVSHSPAKILPTIRSRCQSLALKPLHDDEIVRVLDSFELADDIPSSQQEKLLHLSQGSVRQALMFLRSDGLTLNQKFESLVGNFNTPDWASIQSLADMVAPRGKEDKYRLLLQIAESYVENRATRPNGDKNEISELARWAHVWEKFRNSVSLADSYNLDRKQVIINLFQTMSEANRS